MGIQYGGFARVIQAGTGAVRLLEQDDIRGFPNALCSMKANRSLP